MAIFHQKVVAGLDDTDVARVRNSNWNAAHVSVPWNVTFWHYRPDTWSNVTLAEQEMLPGASQGGHRIQLDLTNGVDEARLVHNFETFNAARSNRVRAQYSADGGSTWRYLDGVDGPSALASSPLGPLPRVDRGAWVTLEAGAKADVIVRIVATGGNGTDTFFPGFLQLQLR